MLSIIIKNQLNRVVTEALTMASMFIAARCQRTVAGTTITPQRFI